MKIISITILTTVLLIGLSLSVDLFVGFNLKTALRDVFSPLRVMELIEWIVFLLYLLLIVISLIYSSYQKRKQNKTT